jgi:nitronate monooxygenase
VASSGVRADHPTGDHPTIIQGGMGAGVSNWRLANAVSRAGQLGVVSGTGLPHVLARRLQDGDPGGHMRRALDHFPVPDIARRIVDRYFLPDGRPEGRPYLAVPMFSARPSTALLELCVAANFVEVWLAKEGHDGIVGVNLLEKIQLPNLASMYGAILAGVDYVLMGAGIPMEIPGALDRLARHEPATLKIDVTGATAEDAWRVTFDPAEIVPPADRPPVKRPLFLAIIASYTLALALQKKATGRVDGFVVEGPTAGGHNAPPRGAVQLNERGEPIYGPRDVVDLEKLGQLGLPFWLAGSYGTRERLLEALSQGAQGIQVGTAFALCEESGLVPETRRALLAKALAGTADVRTDPLASPTGFPFKVASLEGTLSELPVYQARPRRCDMGYLRETYRREDGTLGYRCASEPIDDYLRKGGKIEETDGRKCLCNALLADIGLGQIQTNGYREQPLITAGDDLPHVARFLRPGATSYTAADVLAVLLGERPAAPTTLATAPSTPATTAPTPTPAEAPPAPAETSA